MITQFYVYSIAQLEADTPHEVSHIIVSISTPGGPPAVFKTNEHTLDVLRLWFHDIDRVVEGYSDHLEPEMFQPAHARQILDFVKAHPTAERFIVHCDAGMSRSPAVAAALQNILGGDDSRFFKQYHPNMRVYRTILEEHHKE